MAKSPEALLNELAVQGIQLSVDDAGTITGPVGRLDLIA